MKWLDKKKVYRIVFESDTWEGRLFDVALIVAIIVSIVIAVVESLSTMAGHYRMALQIMEYVLTFFFTIEYVLRIYCSPEPRKYIFSFFGIVDLLATSPLYLSIFFPSARYALIVRAFRLIRIFRIFKLFNFLTEGNLLLRSIQRSMNKILVFFLFVLILVLSIGTLMYMIEGNLPGSGFTDIPTSIYWAIVTLTTVGYGDITPITPLGRFVSGLVMLLGYTIIAVPTGIVSVSIMHEHKRSERFCPKCGCRQDKDAVYCKRCGTKLLETK